MADSHLALLLTPEGWSLLSSLPPYDAQEALALSGSLRKEGYPPDLVAAALTQQRLRERAAAKFGPFARTMLFTPEGLEQATRLVVAAHHAARYAAAGATRVADLGCGIGGDAIALAGLDIPVLAVDHDEATAALATVNLMPFPHATVSCADAMDVDLAAEGVDAVFADPARRSGGRRLHDPEQWSPRLSRILALRDAPAGLEAVGVKVAPGVDHAVLPSQAHVQWVSVDRDVVEAAIWCGPLAPEGPGRSALVLRTGQAQATPHVLSDPTVSDPSSPPLQLDPIDAPEDLDTFVHEPDGAAIRAGLVALVAQHLEARPVGPRIAYLTGPALAGQAVRPFVRSWRLREILPLRLRTLREHVRSHQVARLEIHRRGLNVSPDTLRASLGLGSGLEGGTQETWLLTRVGSRARGAVLVVDPVEMAPLPQDTSAASTSADPPEPAHGT